MLLDRRNLASVPWGPGCSTHGSQEGHAGKRDWVLVMGRLGVDAVHLNHVDGDVTAVAPVTPRFRTVASKGYSIGCSPVLLIDNLNLLDNEQPCLGWQGGSFRPTFNSSGQPVRKIGPIQIFYWLWLAFAVTIPKSADSVMVPQHGTAVRNLASAVRQARVVFRFLFGRMN